MSQNRNKLLDLFIGNLSNAAVHHILEKAIDDAMVMKRYNKEFTISFEKARNYRKRIHPSHTALSDKDMEYITNKLIRKVNAELQQRISNHYGNINLELIEETVQNLLKDTKVI